MGLVAKRPNLNSSWDSSLLRRRRHHRCRGDTTGKSKHWSKHDRFGKTGPCLANCLLRCVLWWGTNRHPISESIFTVTVSAAGVTLRIFVSGTLRVALAGMTRVNASAAGETLRIFVSATRRVLIESMTPATATHRVPVTKHASSISGCTVGHILASSVVLMTPAS